MNKEPGKIKISYVLVKIFELPLNIPKRPSIENIGTKVQSENTRTLVRTSIYITKFYMRNSCLFEN